MGQVTFKHALPINTQCFPTIRSRTKIHKCIFLRLHRTVWIGLKSLGKLHNVKTSTEDITQMKVKTKEKLSENSNSTFIALNLH